MLLVLIRRTRALGIPEPTSGTLPPLAEAGSELQKAESGAVPVRPPQCADPPVELTNQGWRGASTLPEPGHRNTTSGNFSFCDSKNHPPADFISEEQGSLSQVPRRSP